MRSTLQRNLPPMEVEKVQTPVCSGLKSLQTWKALIVRALGRAGISQKHAALSMGITEQQFANQLAYDGNEKRDHLSFWRMRELPPEFWQEVIALMCEYHAIVVGSSAREREDIELGKLAREIVQRAVSR